MKIFVIKNLNNNNYYKVNNALKFWNNKVGDTVVVTFKQKYTERLIYLSIKNLAPKCGTGFFCFYNI